MINARTAIETAQVQSELVIADAKIQQMASKTPKKHTLGIRGRG
jgi:hypothetical protein